MVLPGIVYTVGINVIVLLFVVRRGGKPVPKFPDDVVVLDVAYHGHTQAVVDISPYKWRQVRWVTA